MKDIRYFWGRMKDSGGIWEPVATDFTSCPFEYFWFIGSETRFTNDQIEIGGQLSPPFDKQAMHVLTVEETAKVLRVSKTSIYDAIKEREIPVLSVGRNMRIPTILLQRLLGKRAESDLPRVRMRAIASPTKPR